MFMCVSVYSIRMHVLKYVRMYDVCVCIYIIVYPYTCMYDRMYVCTPAMYEDLKFMYVCINFIIYLFMSVCMYVWFRFTNDLWIAMCCVCWPENYWNKIFIFG